MLKTQLNFRVPHDLRTWLDAAVPQGTSMQEYLISILEKAREGTYEPSLFQLMHSPEIHKPEAIRFRFIDLFAGIGGFRIGMTRAGGRCVFTSEYDKFCQKTYRAWFGEEELIAGDINDVNIDRDIPEHDVLAAGFPCQPFSIAGVSKKNAIGQKHGFDCDRQGNLFFRVCEVIQKKRPPAIVLENVKNLRSHDKGKTYRVIREALDALEYEVFDQIIDAKHWVPQHRERIFIVGFDRNLFGKTPPFSFPEPPRGRTPRVGDILETDAPSKYTLTEHLWNYLQNYAKKHKAAGNGFGFGLVNAGDEVTRTLSARYHKDGSEVLIDDPKHPRPRRLTHREAARLMGFSDEVAAEFGHPVGFPQVVSDTQAYRQFGNAVVPAVAEAVTRQVVSTMAWLLGRCGSGCLVKGRVPRRRRSKPELVAF